MDRIHKILLLFFRTLFIDRYLSKTEHGPHIKNFMSPDVEKSLKTNVREKVNRLKETELWKSKLNVISYSERVIKTNEF